MKRIGITGGIGSGKSTVTRIFSVLGIPVFDADASARQVLLSDPAAIKKVEAIFGRDVFTDGLPDRKKLAATVFRDTDKLRQLEAVLHAATLERFNSWSAEQQAPYVILEAAIMFESGADKLLNNIFAVAAPEDIRISRTMLRDGITEEEVLNRMQHQLPQERLQQYADGVIENSGKVLLIPQVLALHKRIMAAGV